MQFYTRARMSYMKHMYYAYATVRKVKKKQIIALRNLRMWHDFYCTTVNLLFVVGLDRPNKIIFFKKEFYKYSATYGINH